MLDHNVLHVPPLPQWATNAGQTLQPSPGESRVGWTPNMRPPAKWMNWLQRTHYGWLRALLAGTISDWTRTDTHAVAGTGTQLGVYHPSPGVGAAAHLFGSLDGLIYSLGGRNIETGLGGIGALGTRARAIDSAHVMFAHLTTIYYANQATVAPWLAPSTSSPAVGAAVLALATKWGLSDYLIAAGTSGVAIKADGIAGAGAWVPATTPPVGTFLADLAWGGGAVWYGAPANTDDGFYASVDDGDTWTLVNADVVGSGSHAVNSLMRCPHTGRLVILAQNNWPLFSDDDGATWTAAAVSSPDTVPPTNWAGAQAVGAGAFVCAGANGGSIPAHLYSVDGGETWQWFDLPGGGLGGEVLDAIWCDGEKLIGLGSVDGLYTSRVLRADGVPDVGLL